MPSVAGLADKLTSCRNPTCLIVSNTIRILIRHSPDSPQIQGYNHAYSNSPRSEAKKLVPTLETLRDAVNAGELDKLLKEAKSSRNFGRGR